MVKNIKLIISYEGTNYSGWQIQKQKNTIQEEIEKAIFCITNEHTSLIGSGRTDRGVHAIEQTANFKTNSTIPVDKIKLALNGNLPRDIRIIESTQVDMDFHARYDAKGKTYLYQIYNNKVVSPFYAKYVYHVPFLLDFDKMKNATLLLMGTHDFRAFMSSNTEVKTTVRTITDVELSYCENENIIRLEITGSGFLYNMVRIIAGTLIEIGTGRKDATCIEKALETKNRELLGHTARPEGLFMKKVYY